MCGDREIKPLAVKSPGLGRLGRVNQTYLASAPLKTGLLGRLGRLFQTHLGTEATYAKNSDRTADQLSKFKAGVLGVPSEQAIKPHRPLNERERVILSKVEAENESPDFRSTAMFNATVAGIEQSANFTRANLNGDRCPEWPQNRF